MTFCFDRAYNKLVFKRLWSNDYGELLSIVMLIGPETTMNDVQFQTDKNQYSLQLIGFSVGNIDYNCARYPYFST